MMDRPADIGKRLEALGEVTRAAAELFSAALPRIIAVVEETYGLIAAGRTPERTAQLAGESSSLDEADFLRSASDHFGRSLEAIYRYGLRQSLVEETLSLASAMLARSLSGRVSHLLRTWIMAISSAVRSPERYELIRPLEVLRENAGELEALSEARRAARRAYESPFVDAVLAGRTEDAAALARGHYDRHGSDEKTVGELFFPTLAEIGRRWVENRISVAEEHAATAALRSTMHRFFDSLPAARPTGAPVAVACVPGDEHELGAEILARSLAARGRTVYFIGHSAPEGELMREIERGRYAAVLLSVSMVRHLLAFELLVQRLRERVPALTIIAGGGALAHAESLMRSLADATARTPEEAHGMLRRLEASDA